MYTGNNPTALQSKNMITEALLNLLKDKKFNKISIKELCEKALVSRQTFYFLFKTKEQVIESYFDSLFFDYTKTFQKKESITINHICKSAITYLIKNEFFIRILIDNNLNYIMTQKIEQYLFELGDIINANKKNHQLYAFAFIAGALVETLSYYFKNNKDCTPEDISVLIEQIITGNYFEV